MKTKVFRIPHAPASVPNWHSIMADLGDPHPKAVARVLGCDKRTVYRYNSSGHAPRVVLLALYWLTHWGRHDAHTQAFNDCQLATAYARALKASNERLEAQVAHLLAIGQFGAANAPVELLRGARHGHDGWALPTLREEAAERNRR